MKLQHIKYAIYRGYQMISYWGKTDLYHRGHESKLYYTICHYKGLHN